MSDENSFSVCQEMLPLFRAVQKLKSEDSGFVQAFGLNINCIERMDIENLNAFLVSCIHASYWWVGLITEITDKK